MQHKLKQNRRKFIKTAGIVSTAALASCGGGGSDASAQTSDWTMPDEGATHKRTWMAFGASQTIWGSQLLPEARRNLALIANTLVTYENVTMLVRASEMALARSLLNPAVELQVATMDDLWIRDTGPCFVRDSSGVRAALNLNFNGWGEKQDFTNDALVASKVAELAGARELFTDLVLEGGCIEVDGEGTAIITESCVLNDNRNPGVTKAPFEQALMPLLGLKKIIWLPGIKDQDITDGHTDFYARFARPGVVVAGLENDTASFDYAVTRRHLDILRAATDAKGRALEVLTLTAPSSVRPAFDSDEFAAGYIGYYVANGVVLMQNFGDASADQQAKAALQKAFPTRAVVALNIDGIAAGGGSIHCATQQEPA